MGPTLPSETLVGLRSTRPPYLCRVASHCSVHFLRTVKKMSLKKEKKEGFLGTDAQRFSRQVSRTTSNQFPSYLCTSFNSNLVN